MGLQRQYQEGIPNVEREVLWTTLCQMWDEEQLTTEELKNFATELYDEDMCRCIFLIIDVMDSRYTLPCME